MMGLPIRQKNIVDPDLNQQQQQPPRRKSRTCGRQRFSLLSLSKSFAQGIGPAELSVCNPLPLSHSLSLSLLIEAISSRRFAAEYPDGFSSILFVVVSSLVVILLCFSHFNLQRISSLFFLAQSRRRANRKHLLLYRRQSPAAAAAALSLSECAPCFFLDEVNKAKPF